MIDAREPRKPRNLDFNADGAEIRPSAISSADVAVLKAIFAPFPPSRAGVRIHGVSELQPLLAADGVIGAVARSVLPGAKPVRAVYFDKSAETNWALGWHQDRTIAVRERVDVPGFGPWTNKSGLLHVAPPFEVLAGMVTLRVHLDPVSATNAPLRIAPGSHRLGRIPEAEVPNVVAQCGEAICLSDEGDVWLYSTPILHASDAAVDPTHRRVLQVDYAAGDLPGGLEWLGV